MRRRGVFRNSAGATSTLAVGPAYGAGFAASLRQGLPGNGHGGGLSGPDKLTLAFLTPEAGVRHPRLGCGVMSRVPQLQPPSAMPRAAAATEFIPHGCWVTPISNKWKFGLGVESPFGLVTRWKDPSNFSRPLPEHQGRPARRRRQPDARLAGDCRTSASASAPSPASPDVELQPQRAAHQPLHPCVRRRRHGSSWKGDFSNGYGLATPASSARVRTAASPGAFLPLARSRSTTTASAWLTQV